MNICCIYIYIWRVPVLWPNITKYPFMNLLMASKVHTISPKKYAHGFVVPCFVVVMQSFIMNSHEVFIHIHQGCFAGTGAIVRLPQCQWSKPDGYGKISQCITTTKHSKAKTVCIFLGIYCTKLYKLLINIIGVTYILKMLYWSSFCGNKWVSVKYMPRLMIEFDIC